MKRMKGMKEIRGRGCILLFLLVSWMGYSQETDFQPEWAFGMNGGITLSEVGFVPRIPQELLVQSSGGLTARYIQEDHFGLQLELNYSLRGWKHEVDTAIYLNHYAESLLYLELPLMTHIYFNLGNRTRLIFNVGPQISYHIGEKVLEKNIVNHDYDFYEHPQVQNKFDYGITGGLGMELRTGIGHFILEGRYFFGLSDIFYNGREYDFQASHNQVIGIKMTYLLP
ncbi:MAG: PorT family protein [Candidatus Symbiothrix sp.]|nr:PorT family protein [Candidatus Symbiothrix sp.]